jgi:hypothetical protein
MKKQTGTLLPLLLTTLIGSLSVPLHASTPGVSGIVGEVSLVVGKAWILHPGAARERIRRGSVISVFDAIETSNNGHVHVHFVDGALVSVRPASTLEILRYEYDPASPAQSAVTLNLVEGVTRAISGEAAKNARENFRLNTPIAAIGVRGTDFVVSANRDSVRALVTEGAIILTPFSSDCQVDALSPCSQNGLELAGGSGQIMQLTANGRDPVLLPTAASGLPELVADAPTASDEAQDERKKEDKAGDLYADTVTTRTVNQTIADTRAAAPSPTPAPSPAPTPTPSPPPSPPPLPEFTPDVALDVATLTTENQMVWGRYATSDTHERITTVFHPYDPLFQGLKVASGNNHYSLFRLPNETQTVQGDLGLVGFTLDKAQAQYTSGGVTSLMDVNGGSLSIDFRDNTFATSLNLNHVDTGTVMLVDSGRVFSSGVFHNIYSDAQWVAGAVSFDGNEAGYFFEKALENGRIEGLTLWGRQP